MPPAQDFNIGDILWVNLEGFPWWPARVINPSSEELAALKLKKVPADKFVVRFFNDGGRYTLTNEGNVRPFRKDNFYTRRLEFPGKLYKPWKGALDEAWHYVKNRDPDDHPDARPRSEDVPKRSLDHSPPPPARKRSSMAADPDRRSKKRKRAPAASAAASAAASSPARDSDSDDNPEILPKRKEKVKKRSRKSEPPRAKKDASSASHPAPAPAAAAAPSERDHVKPPRRRVAAILSKDTADDNSNASNPRHPQADPYDQHPLPRPSRTSASAAPTHSPSAARDEQRAHRNDDDDDDRHHHDHDDETGAAVPASPDRDGPSADIRPRRVKELSSVEKRAAGGASHEAQDPDAGGTDRATDHHHHVMARDDEYVHRDSVVDRREEEPPTPDTPGGTPSPSRVATPPLSPPPSHSAHDLSMKARALSPGPVHDGGDEVGAGADDGEDKEELDPEDEEKLKREFLKQSDAHHKDAYDALTKETCVQLLIAKDRALRESNMKLWRHTLKHTKKDKLLSQDGFDDFCSQVIEVGMEFVKMTEEETDAAKKKGVAFVRSREVSDLENRAHDEARQLEKIFFDMEVVDITASGDLLMEFVERVAPLSAPIGVLVRDMVILWLDVMSLTETKSKPKRQSRASKRSSKHKKGAKNTTSFDDAAAGDDGMEVDRPNSRASTREGRNEGSSHMAHSYDDDELSHRSSSPEVGGKHRSPSIGSDDSDRRTARTRRRDEDEEDGRNRSDDEGREVGPRKRWRGRGRGQGELGEEEAVERRNGGSGARGGESRRLDDDDDDDVEANDSIERGKSDISVDAQPKFIDPKTTSLTYKRDSRSHSPASLAKSDVEMDDSPKGQTVETDDARPIRQPTEEDSTHGRKQGGRNAAAAEAGVGATGFKKDGSGGEQEGTERHPRAPRWSVPSLRRDEGGTERKVEVVSGGGGRDKNRKSFGQDDCKKRIEDCLVVLKESSGIRLKKQQRSAIATEMAEQLFRFDDKADGYYNAHVVLIRCVQHMMKEIQKDDSQGPMIEAFRACIDDLPKARDFIDICLKGS